MTVCVRSELLSAAGFRHGFSLRTGGVSETPFDSLNLARNLGDSPASVAENHRRLAEAVGYGCEELFEVSQVHGDRVESADVSVSAPEFRAREADSVLTTRRDRAVGIRVADCVPVLLADPESGAVAAVHAGWRGVVADVVGRAVAALAQVTRAHPARFLAAVGPHIGPEAFEVGPEVAEQLLATVPDVPGLVIPRSPRPHADLAQAVFAQLVRAGLERRSVDRVPGCTFAESHRFFSFRRDGKASGRHLAVIVAGC